MSEAGRWAKLHLNQWTPSSDPTDPRDPPPADDATDPVSDTGRAPDLVEEIEAWRCWDVSVVSYRNAQRPKLRPEASFSYLRDDFLNVPLFETELFKLPIVRLSSITPSGSFLAWPANDWMVATCQKRDYYSQMYGLLWGGLDAKPAEDPPHPSPEESCTCGIYAASTLENLVAHGYPFQPSDLPWALGAGAQVGSQRSIRVYGRVGLAGKVIEATRGYRAEKARVLEVFILDRDWDEDLALGIRESYRVPVKRGALPVPDFTEMMFSMISAGMIIHGPASVTIVSNAGGSGGGGGAHASSPANGPGGGGGSGALAISWPFASLVPVGPPAPPLGGHHRAAAAAHLALLAIAAPPPMSANEVREQLGLPPLSDDPGRDGCQAPRPPPV